MPYSSISELPDAVKALPEGAQRQFLAVFNSAHKKGGDEESCFAQAWGALKNAGWYKDDSGKWVKKAAPRPLYVYRPVKNAAKLIRWFKSQGLKTTLPPDEMHVTLIYSRQPVDWMAMGDPFMLGPPDGNGDLTVPEGGPRLMEAFGPDKSATVLLFSNESLKYRNEQMRSKGASADFPNYQPHITISYERPADLPLDRIEPYKGEIVLGPECFENINDDYREELVEKARIVKVDEDQRMVYGWASVVTEKGQPVIDLQGDIIRPTEMVKAATEFMIDLRKALIMHARAPDGSIDPSMVKGVVVHSLPLTTELAKSLGIHTDREGWIIAMKIMDDEAWKMVKSGQLKAFSIGGTGDRVKADI